MPGKKVLNFGIIAILSLWLISPVRAQDKNNSEEVFQLGEIVVTAEKQTVNLATSVSEVTLKDIKAQGAETAADALEFLPGVDVSVGGKNQSHVNIRGFSQGDVKVLIDGVPVHETYFRTIDLSMIPVDAISKITVTKGATSVLYGPNTMGGVVNIITKKGGKEPFTSFKAAGGNCDTRHAILNHGGALGELNYWLTYGYRESDGYRLSGDFDANNQWVGKDSSYHEDGGTRDLSYYTKRTLNAKIGYEPDKNSSLYLSFDYHNNERGVPVEYNRYWAFPEWDQWNLNLVGKNKINDLITLKGKIFYTDFKDTLVDVSHGDKQTQRKWFEWSTYDDYSIGGDFQAHLNLTERNLLKIGFNYIKDYHEQQDLLGEDCLGVIRGWAQPGLQPKEDYEADTYSLGIEDEIYLSRDLSFVAGVSYDRYIPQKAYDQPTPDSADTLNPQAGLVYSITPRTELHASVGKKTRFPHLKELYSKYAGGNPDLEPQKTVSYEIGANRSFMPNLKGSIAYFYNDIDDLIESVEAGGEDIYKNTGSAVIQGIETRLDYQVTNNFEMGLNYTYLSTENKDKDRDLPDRPRHKINLDSGYHFDFGLSAFIQASYLAEQFEYDYDQKHEYPDYLLLNAKFTQDLGTRWGINSELFLKVHNLTDKFYEEGRPMPGRNFLAGLSFQL
ncbi:MAG: TonB-dependent receptor [Thermodesulfobacteriota bacterium]|nr:TonB-dependent receptor [Thermodesulfobacteriota bacterium]